MHCLRHADTLAFTKGSEGRTENYAYVQVYSIYVQSSAVGCFSALVGAVKFPINKLCWEGVVYKERETM